MRIPLGSTAISRFQGGLSQGMQYLNHCMAIELRQALPVDVFRRLHARSHEDSLLEPCRRQANRMSAPLATASAPTEISGRPRRLSFAVRHGAPMGTPSKFCSTAWRATPNQAAGPVYVLQYGMAASA
eukprot:jgi/Botrbrau1/20491/Bobra.145_2s0050.1